MELFSVLIIIPIIVGLIFTLIFAVTINNSFSDIKKISKTELGEEEAKKILGNKVIGWVSLESPHSIIIFYNICKTLLTDSRISIESKTEVEKSRKKVTFYLVATIISFSSVFLVGGIYLVIYSVLNQLNI